MAFKFPFTNYHELNLTWVLEQLKKLFEDSEENVETIEGYEDRLSAVEDELPVVEATADQAAQTANAAATLAQTAKNTADTANENALAASAQAGLARQEAAEAEAEAQAATQAAQQVQAIVQDFDGRITQAEDDASEALQEAQSFENRVNAAINTANNAANTATIAQGIAVNANQNAATALDTAQTADGKAEAAQDAADIADGKAEAAQNAADIADGKAEAAQDAADIADGKAEAAQDTADQNADKIGNLSDLTTTAKNNLVAAINEAAQTGGGTDDTKAPLIVSEASGVVASFSDGADNMQIQELVCNIVPLQAAGTPSPDNPLPISTRNGMTITRTGKNLFGGDAFYNAWVKAGIVGTSGEDENGRYVTIPSNTSVMNKILFDVFKPDTVYTVICRYKKNNTNNNTNMQVMYTDNYPLYIQYITDVVADVVYTSVNVSNGAKSIANLGTLWASGIATVYYDYFGVFEGVLTADDFEAYTGISVPITFPANLYGGRYELINGTLQSLYAEVDLGDIPWISEDPTIGRFRTATLINVPAFNGKLPAYNSNFVCSIYKSAGTQSYSYSVDESIFFSNNGVQSNIIRINDSTKTNMTAEEFTEAVRGQKLVYELNTPLAPVQLSPNELTTLYGLNNVFTDAGSIQSCKYPADTKLYIDGKVAELQALILEN